MLKNTPEKYGMITKILHASIGSIIIYLLYLGYTMLEMENSPEKWQEYATHKSFGMVVLFLVSLFYIWKIFNSKVDESPAVNYLAKILSKVVKFSLLTIMLLYPLTGYIMSSAGGHEIVMFDKVSIPLLIEKGSTLFGYNIGDIAHAIHGYLFYITLGLLSLHILGALYHHFILKDDVLKRMTIK